VGSAGSSSVSLAQSSDLQPWTNAASEAIEVKRLEILFELHKLFTTRRPVNAPRLPHTEGERSNAPVDFSPSEDRRTGANLLVIDGRYV
jgi:hypothetical protein